MRDAAAEERVGGQGPEGVVADLGVGGRGAAVDQPQVGVGVEEGRVEEDQPGVDPARGLGRREGEGRETWLWLCAGEVRKGAWDSNINGRDRMDALSARR